MPSVKTSIGIVLVISSATFTFLIIKNSKLSENPGNLVVKTDNSAMVQGVAENGFLPDSDIAPEETPPAINLPQSSTTYDENNLTYRLAKELAGRITSDNPNGPEMFQDHQNTIRLPKEIDAQNFFLKNQDILNWRALIPIVADGVIKVIPDSEENYVNYIKNFGQIYVKTASGISIDRNSKPDINQLEEIAKIFSKNYIQATADFYNLPVPASLKNIHKREITLMTVQASLFEKMEKSQEDPLAGILALNGISAINDEFRQIKKELTEFAQKNNLKFN